MTRSLRQLDRLRSAVGCRFRVKPEFVAEQDLSPEGLLDFALWSGNPDPGFFAAAAALDGSSAPVTPPPTWLAGIVTPYLGAQALYSGRAAARIEYIGEAPTPPQTAAEPPLLWLDNLRAFLAGIGFEYIATPTVGESFTAEGQVTGVDVRTSGRLGEFAVVHTELVYRNLRGVDLAVGRGSAIVYDVTNVAAPQPSGDAGSKGAPTRGADPYVEVASDHGSADGSPLGRWDDATVGDTVQLLRRGPLRPAEIAAFFVKPGRSAAADREIVRARSLLTAGRFDEARRVYRAVAVNSDYDFGLPRHTDDQKAKSEGAPGAYDVGLQRAAWIAQGLTERLGAGGRLRSVWVEIRGFVVVGDVVTAVARVAETVSDADQKQVRVEIEMHNQHGRLVARGDAGVIAAPPMRGERNSNG